MIKFYSTGCPRCKVLKTKLDDAKIEYEVHSDIEEMTTLGIKGVPVLDVDGERMSFGQAVKWLKEIS
jgi:predicted DsbA family dithiol-disulfide isomerase